MTGDGQASNTTLGGDRSKRQYQAPQLVLYGSVKVLTRNGAGSGTDGTLDPAMSMTSDRRLKENIVRVGEHPLGFGLYLFDYKAEWQPRLPSGRQFGVMADEVEKILPRAVSIATDGYRRVDYAAIGITSR